MWLKALGFNSVRPIFTTNQWAKLQKTTSVSYHSYSPMPIFRGPPFFAFTLPACLLSFQPMHAQFRPPTRLLMGPGPSNVAPSVLEAMAMPLLGHLDPLFVKMMDEIKSM